VSGVEDQGVPNDAVLVHDVDAVRVIVMHRPDSLNGLSTELIVGIESALEAAADDNDVGAVVLAGSGVCFSSGADLGLVRDGHGKSLEQLWSENLDAPPSGDLAKLGANRLALALHDFSKPLIAAVGGAAAGGGMGLALLCDIRLASPDAFFMTVFARLGVAADMGVSYTLPRVVGPSMAAELLFTARSVKIDEAKEIGLVDHVVSADTDLLEAAVDLGKRIARNPVAGLAVIKQALRNSPTATLREQLELEWSQQCAAFDDDETRARIEAVIAGLES